MALILACSSPGAAQEPTRVRLAYSAFSIAFLNVFLAKDAAFFKQRGIEAELIQMAGPIPVAALVAGEIDYMTGFTTGLVAAGQGAPLKGVMVTLRKPPFFVVAEPSVQRLEDLLGKRLGVDRIGSLQQLVARLLFKVRGLNPEKVLFTQTGSVSNTVASLGQGAVAAALPSGPHNVIMAQKGFRQIASAAELPMHFPTSGLVVHEAKLRSDPGQIRQVIRSLLDSLAFSRRERARVAAYIRDKWKLDGRVAEEVYEQWVGTLQMDGRVGAEEMQEYFDLAYAYKQIPVPVQVKAVTDYTLLEQVLRETAR